ncbi:MAG: hypothetical protein U1E28_12755 [Beijerinckiaceae bacterium]
MPACFNQLSFPLLNVAELDSADGLPAGVDKWLVASLLQKSIRRGDVQLAGRGAISLYRLVGPAIWRRFVVIVFEDVGAGFEGALKFAVHAAERRSRYAND